jgi:hypothetical protein
MNTSGFAKPLFLPEINNNLNFLKVEHPMYPNPVVDVLIVESASDYSLLKVYNANAILAATGKGKQLDVSKLTKGFYMLLVDNNSVGKFVKK